MTRDAWSLMAQPTTRIGGCPDGGAALSLLSAFVSEWPELDSEHFLDWVAVQSGLVRAHRADAGLAARELRHLYARRLQSLGGTWQWANEVPWQSPPLVLKRKQLGNWLVTLEPR